MTAQDEAVEQIERSAWTPAPWGAAQGTSYEIKRWPDGAGGYAARVSVAEIVAPGPFTALPGYQRWLAVLDDGGGLELAIGGRRWRGVVGEAVAFDGSEVVHATIARPARVWNLIVKAHVPWSAVWHRDESALTLPCGVAVVHAVASAATRVTTSMAPIALTLDTAPVIVVHLGLGC